MIFQPDSSRYPVDSFRTRGFLNGRCSHEKIHTFILSGIKAPHQGDSVQLVFRQAVSTQPHPGGSDEWHHRVRRLVSVGCRGFRGDV